jgi:hypothetical protein
VVDSAGDAGFGEHRVVSWNAAAEMKLSVESDAFGIRRSRHLSREIFIDVAARRH